MSNRNVITWTLLVSALVVIVGLQSNSRSTSQDPSRYQSMQGLTAATDPAASDSLVLKFEAPDVNRDAVDASARDIRPAVLSEPIEARPLSAAKGRSQETLSRRVAAVKPPVSHFARVKAQMHASDASPKVNAWAESFRLRTRQPEDRKLADSPEAFQSGENTSHVTAPVRIESTPRCTVAVADVRNSETPVRSNVELAGGSLDQQNDRGEVERKRETLGPAPIEAPWQLASDVEIQVAHHLEYGKSLARRGALYSAELEFLRGLRIVAQSIDRQSRTNEHARRLDLALQSIREADALHRMISETAAVKNLREVTGGLATRIFSDRELSQMTPAEVVEGYQAFAERNLVYAGGRTIVAAEAAFCLGKLNSLKDQTETDARHVDRDHAILFHRVALQSDPRHDRAANELGVLYAEAGRLGDAKQVLIQSLKIRQRPETWANLTIVHERLGEQQLAQLAAIELQKALRGDLPAPSLDRAIQWLPPEQFARQSPRPLVESNRESQSIRASKEQPVRTADRPSSVLERTNYESERRWR